MTITGYGLPLAMLASAHAFFLSLPAAAPYWWTPAGFVIGAAACIAVGLATGETARLAALYRRALAIGCLALPVLRLATRGTSWAEAVAQDHGPVLSVDILLLAGGVTLLLWKPRDRGAMTGPLGRRMAEPAE